MNAVNADHSADRVGLMKRLRGIARHLRVLSLQAVFDAGSGHPGGSLSAAEIMAALYFHKLRINPRDPNWADRDRFILSKGHATPVLYAALAHRGYFGEDELLTERALGSRLQGHPDLRKTPGVDMSSGSLGQGLSVGLGMAMANRLVGPSVHVYVLLGDGELQEGQVWEAAMAAAHFRATGLVAIVDWNEVQCDGPVAEIMEIAPLADKWRAFGWAVLEIDGHDISAVVDAIDRAEEISDTGPVVVLAHTIKGKGVSFMEGDAVWHATAPDADQLRAALDEIGRRG